MSNTITAFFKGRTGVCESVYQYDYGMVIVLDGIDDLTGSFDCYFSTSGEEEAIPAIGTDNRVAIPNNALTRSGNVELHIPIHTGANDSEVEYVVAFKVIGRARPVDDGTPEQQTAIQQALALLQNPIDNIEQIVNEALSFTGDTFDQMQEQLDADQSAFETEMGTRADTFESGITSRQTTVESQFTNLTTNLRPNSVKTLWTGSIGSIGNTATLSESAANFDFLDIYTSLGTYTRVASSAGTVKIHETNLADSATSSVYQETGETTINFSGTTASIASAITWEWNSDAATKPSHSARCISYITRIDGVKVGANEPAELTDIRVGADGNNYSSAGESVRTQFTNLKSDYIDIGDYIGFANSHPSVTKGGFVNTAGNIVSYAGYFYTDKIPISAGDTIVSTGSGSGLNIISLYKSDDTYYKGASATSETVYTLTATFDGYARVSGTVAKLNELNIDIKSKDNIWDGLANTNNDVNYNGNRLDRIVSVENFFDKSTVETNKYLNSSDGTVATDNTDTFFLSDYIDISHIEEVSLSYTHIACWYKADKTFISAVSGMNTRTADATVSVPSGAKYIRFSGFIKELNDAQVGIGVSRNSYIPYDIIVAHSLVVPSDNAVVYVDANGGGDFTSLTEALYTTRNDVIVRKGTYDMIAEYKAMFGNDIWTTMDEDTPLNHFQHALWVTDRKVTFESGAVVVADYVSEGVTVNATHRFCLFILGKNAVIDGLHGICNGGWYIIHDDDGDSSPYTNIIRNCVLIGSNLVNRNCIGGGCKAKSLTIIDNCYCENGNGSSGYNTEGIRYHNTNATGATPKVIIKNTRVNGWIGLRYYGSQETKMVAIVNNCNAPAGVVKMEESSSFSVDNIDVYAWNNLTT